MKELMKRIIFACSLILAFAGCEEAELTPSHADRNHFLEPFGASAEERTIMSQFFSTTGVYVLFNELLERKSLGTNAAGVEVYQDITINMPYGMNSATTDIFEYELMETLAEKQAAVKFITEDFLPSLSQAMRPFSFLLVRNIDQYVSSASTGYALTKPRVYAGWRCTAVAMDGVDQMTEQELFRYKMSLLNSIVNRVLTTASPTIFDEFHTVSAAYASVGFSFDPINAFPNLFSLEILSDVRNTGFLTAYQYHAPGATWSNGFVNFKARNLDLTDYINLVFSKTEEEIRAEHGSFPLVIKKYELLKSVILQLGVIL